MRLEMNGRKSVGKRTKHIDIRYFYVSDKVSSKEISVAYCPTTEMVADYFTKPLQGSLFIKFRDLIQGIDHIDIPQYNEEAQTYLNDKQSRIDALIAETTKQNITMSPQECVGKNGLAHENTRGNVSRA